MHGSALERSSPVERPERAGLRKGTVVANGAFWTYENVLICAYMIITLPKILIVNL